MVKIISKVSAGKIRKGETITLSQKDADYWLKKGLGTLIESEIIIKAPEIKPPPEIRIDIIKPPPKARAKIIRK